MAKLSKARKALSEVEQLREENARLREEIRKLKAAKPSKAQR